MSKDPWQWQDQGFKTVLKYNNKKRFNLSVLADGSGDTVDQSVSHWSEKQIIHGDIWPDRQT